LGKPERMGMLDKDTQQFVLGLRQLTGYGPQVRLAVGPIDHACVCVCDVLVVGSGSQAHSFSPIQAPTTTCIQVCPEVFVKVLNCVQLVSAV